ncbi:helix-turn-helix domain-containing protein [Streptomyces sp. NPDC058394]|uniref:helix-turn-helix domain-containing protein n=1 Tax=unclassified Streptomyces TaxID=2593676 RepID=UPI003646C804
MNDLVRTDLATAAASWSARSPPLWTRRAMAHGRPARWLVLPSHTLRYRLRRARERFGVDLDDPDTRLLITTTVRLSG